MEKRLPKSTRKFIRLQKVLIRRQFSDFEKQEEMINALYNRFLQHQEVEKTNEVKAEKKEVKNVKAKVSNPVPTGPLRRSFSEASRQEKPKVKKVENKEKKHETKHNKA